MKFVFLILIFCGLFISCEEEHKPEDIQAPDWTTEKSTELNKRFAQEEEIGIRLYLKQRPQWKMTETGSGLRYWIYEDYEGPVAELDDFVDVAFEVRLLDDSLVYESGRNEVSTFKVDKSDVETGVQEGIKYLSEGDKAKFIIPSHLAHGLLGDQHKIPPLQVLVVDIELKKIKKQ
ncbi:MAG: FKBP-type peptidyl-prolyl cis-trans isomerase [Brumimicrobium sp.]|nr:FKBP-type peptidyl-prolyl cis-trans isomerase [Brumimicrobium sp.]